MSEVQAEAIERSLPSEIGARMRRFGTEGAHVPALAFALGLLGVIVFLAIFGPVFWRIDPLEIDIAATLQPPSWAHPMGTDSVGRDVFARFNEGARISLLVGLAVIAIGGAIGAFIGLVAGAFGRWVDGVSMRVMDAILAFPPLILAMAVTVGLGAGLTTAAIGIILTSVPYYARIIRADVLRIRGTSFVEAAYASGATAPRIIGRHIVPNTMVSLPILAAANFGYAILTLAALGFVGLGAQIPTPEWGTMITEGQQYILTGGWWIGLFPGLGILIVVTATSILADRIRDILDPRGRLPRT
jgi:peptide/nickel transport system permease protein